MSTEPLLDKFGQEIKPGQWIVYGHNLGRCAGLRLGVVLAVKRGEPSYAATPWNREDRITVWGFDDDSVEYSRYHPNDEWSRPKPLRKKSTLLFSSRIVVLRPEMVPEDYRKQLSEIAVEHLT